MAKYIFIDRGRPNNMHRIHYSVISMLNAFANIFDGLVVIISFGIFHSSLSLLTERYYLDTIGKYEKDK
jgi:hypothetical protein